MPTSKDSKKRAPVSRRTLPNLPWDFRRDPPQRQVFVMGIANKRTERVNGEPWPVVYKIVRWYRLSLLRFTTQAKQNARVKAFIAERSADVIEEGLRSVHTLCVIDVRSPGHRETVRTTPIRRP